MFVGSQLQTENSLEGRADDTVCTPEGGKLVSHSGIPPTTAGEA